MRIKFLAGAVALSALLFAGPAHAGVEVGEEAPSFNSGDFINCEPIQISDLTGRLVLLELFTTT